MVITNIATIKISEAECDTLDSTWSKVVTDATLPVQYGVEITLACPADLVNTGGNKATCLYGHLVPTTTPPQCPGMLYVFLYDVSCCEKLTFILYEQH